MLVVVGNYFAVASDRLHPLPDLQGYEGPQGGMAALVDFALGESGNSSLRSQAERLLDLTGSFGEVYTVEADDDNDSNATSAVPEWRISKSTMPWNEGKRMFSECSVTLRWRDDHHQTAPGNSISHFESLVLHSIISCSSDGFVQDWEVLECSFTEEELNRMFSPFNTISRL